MNGTILKTEKQLSHPAYHYMVDIMELVLAL